ncbi:DUF4894 domain-containing protein [Pseudothermotoga sp.]|uniref:DUF4894 domain-containing protein n=1 Tax=Pseudothermotoga sp. TaxID=2033661 RepID=UPI0031F6193F
MRIGRTPVQEKGRFLVAHKGRFWWVGESGRLVGVARSEDVLSKAYVSGLKIENAKIDENTLKLIWKLESILEDPHVVEVILEERKVVLLKGVTVKFNDWNDLLKNLQLLPEAIKKMEPKGEYFLSSQGLFYKLRGGDNEER